VLLGDADTVLARKELMTGFDYDVVIIEQPAKNIRRYL